MRRTAFCIGLTLLLGACAPQGMYVWNGYQEDLYGYYQDTEQLSELMAALQTTIDDSEKAIADGKTTANGGKILRVAPGLYAEYGYLLLLSNRPAEAKTYFEKEKATWPESTTLMDRMIVVASNTKFRPSQPGAEKTANSGSMGEKR